MYLMYVDESGDPGTSQYSSPHYILSGLIINSDNWQRYLVKLKALRKSLSSTYGLNQRTEIHASELIRINQIDEYRNIKKADRIAILKFYCDQIPIIFDDAKVLNVCLMKSSYTNSMEIHLFAWQRLIQRYDRYLKKTVKDKGLVIADETNGKDIIQLLRKMRIYSPVTSHFGGYYNAATDNIIEDLFQRQSHDSFFIQTVDVIAHSLYRKEIPKGSLKKFGVEKYFDFIEPILLKEAAGYDKFGIVRK